MKRSRFFLIIATLFTFFICFIDEGYYNFMWMKEWGNWIAFTIYIFVMYTMQELLYKILKNKVAVSVLGIILGLIFLFWLLG